MKKAEKKQAPDMLDEYDFAGGVRGKYAARYAAGVTVTVTKTLRRKPATEGPAVAPSPSAPRFPLKDRKPGRSSAHYAEVAA
jgi:hypothetical protein